jgi:DNA-binding IclR family transcriptional regulator
MATDGMLAKGLNILEALGGYPDGVGVSEVARKVGLPVSTVHRLLATLVDRGFVTFDPVRRQYFLGLKVFELSTRVTLAKGLSEVALPAMRRLAHTIGEAVSLAVREGTELVYIEMVQGERSRIQISGSIGARGPLYATSQGKAILAFLPNEEREEIINKISLEPRAPNTITDPAKLRKELEGTQKRGWAVADEENEEGIRAVGVPLMSARGYPIAAMSVATPVFRVSQEDLERFAPLLQDAAREIELRLPQSAASLASA